MPELSKPSDGVFVRRTGGLRPIMSAEIVRTGRNRFARAGELKECSESFAPFAESPSLER
jgi:hypothetical protein